MPRKPKPGIPRPPRGRENDPPDVPPDEVVERALDKLTYRQRLFVEAYIGPANGNAARALRMSGYGEKLDGKIHRMLTMPAVAAAISARVAQAGMAANEVLARLADHASATVEDFLDIKPDGSFTINLEKARRAQRLGLIRRVSINSNGPVLELYDAQAALALFMRYHGLIKANDYGPPDKEAEARTDPMAAAAALEGASRAVLLTAGGDGADSMRAPGRAGTNGNGSH